MDEPLMLLSAAIDAMYSECPTCKGVGKLPTTTRVEVTRNDSLPPALAEIADTHIKRHPFWEDVPGEPITCPLCNGRGKNPTNEGRAVAERLARMLAPFLDNALEPAPHEHPHSHEVY